MKFVPSTGLKVLLIWSVAGCTYENFAAPPGKDFWNRVHHGSTSIRHFFAGRGKTINKDGYLAAQAVPQLLIGGLRKDQVQGYGSRDTPMQDAADEREPSLESFLELLQQGREMNEFPDATRPAGLDSLMKSLETVQQEQEDSPADKESPETADGQSGKAGETASGDEVAMEPQNLPLFPRPYARELIEENLFMYFPLEAIGTVQDPFVIISPKAIFQRPDGEAMESTATLQMEP